LESGAEDRRFTVEVGSETNLLDCFWTAFCTLVFRPDCLRALNPLSISRLPFWVLSLNRYAEPDRLIAGRPLVTPATKGK